MCFIASKQRQYSFNQTYYNKTLTNRKSTTPRVLRSACMRLICHVLRQKNRRCQQKFFIVFIYPQSVFYVAVLCDLAHNKTSSFPSCEWRISFLCMIGGQSLRLSLSQHTSEHISQIIIAGMCGAHRMRYGLLVEHEYIRGTGKVPAIYLTSHMLTHVNIK